MPWGYVAAATLGSSLIGADAAGRAADTSAAASRYAADIQKQMFDTQNAQQAPYRAAGYSALNQIAGMNAGGQTYDANGNPIGNVTGTGYLTHQFTPEDFAAGIDPGYAWRLQQGQQATQRAANVGGGALSGNTLAGLDAYTQGLASQEYGNAFNRYQTQRGNIYNTLAGIAGLGQTSLGQTGQASTQTAGNIGSALTAAGQAQAAGQVGTANALSGGITGAANAYALSNMLQPQTQNGMINIPGEGTMSIAQYFRT